MSGGPAPSLAVFSGKRPEAMQTLAGTVPFARASAATGNLTCVVRAASPRFICWTDSSRSRWNFSISVGIFDSLLQLRQEGCGEVVELGFLIDDQEPNGFRARVEVNHPGAAAFALSSGSPAHLSAAAAASDNVSGVGVGGERGDRVDDAGDVAVVEADAGLGAADSATVFTWNCTALPYFVR